MRAIITRQNADGSYDGVGMNNRYLTKDYRLQHNLLTFGLSARVGTYRVEIFHGSIHRDPSKILYVERTTTGYRILGTNGVTYG